MHLMTCAPSGTFFRASHSCAIASAKVDSSIAPSTNGRIRSIRLAAKKKTLCIDSTGMVAHMSFSLESTVLSIAADYAPVDE